MMDLEQIEFTNSFVDNLPGESGIADQRSRTVLNACFSYSVPEPVRQPSLLAWSENLSNKFNLNKPKDLSPSLNILAGNLLLPSMKSYSACYGGHQFGHWAGALGDGRAITLGEVSDIENNTWELQLKGAGPTPYSRRGDGRAVLRSSVREFLASEAMFHLGVPTTRALSLVGTGDSVIRDMFYNGDLKNEQGAITARMAPSFLRFGSFEIHSSRGDLKTLTQLCDWTIKKFFSIKADTQAELYLKWFDQICQKTAELIIEWERVGFVHGVMNTDNMSILGLTIDYGPFGWLDSFNPFFTPNTTDLPGRRYCFSQQSAVAYWNLERLAEALVLLVGDFNFFQPSLEAYILRYEQGFKKMMLSKLGLSEWIEEIDFKLITQLMDLFQSVEVDYNLFFRSLSEEDFRFESSQMTEVFYEPLSLETSQALNDWLALYQRRSLMESSNSMNRSESMKRVNPKYIPRNYLLFKAIEGLEKGDPGFFEDLFKVLRNPYDENRGLESFSFKRPDWARETPGCSTLSCSS